MALEARRREVGRRGEESASVDSGRTATRGLRSGSGVGVGWGVVRNVTARTRFLWPVRRVWVWGRWTLRRGQRRMLAWVAAARVEPSGETARGCGDSQLMAGLQGQKETVRHTSGYIYTHIQDDAILNTYGRNTGIIKGCSVRRGSRKESGGTCPTPPQVFRDYIKKYECSVQHLYSQLSI